MRVQRLAPLSGIVFFVLLAAALEWSGDSPEPDASPAKIVSWYTDHHSRELVTAVLVAVAAVFLAGFVSALRERVRAAEGEARFWSNVVLIGGAAAVAGFLLGAATAAALADAGANQLGSAALVTLNELSFGSVMGLMLPLAVMLFGAAGATLSAAVLPRWLGWAALVLGIVMFVPADFAFLGFVLSGIWIVIVSIVIWRGEAAVAPARPRASVMEAH